MRAAYLLSIVFLPLILLDTPAHAACTDPDGVPGDIVYNSSYEIFQGCTDRGWASFHAPSSTPAIPPDCPNIGDICTDGTIYAGVYNGKRLLVAADDAPSARAWGPNPSTTGLVICEFAASPSSGCETGALNTQTLKNHASTFPAAEYCANLSAHGYTSGWFLPAYNEMWHIHDVLKRGKPAGTFNFVHMDYWTSTEDVSQRAWYMTFIAGGDATFMTQNKAFPKRVRCAREG